MKIALPLLVPIAANTVFTRNGLPNPAFPDFTFDKLDLLAVEMDGAAALQHMKKETLKFQSIQDFSETLLNSGADGAKEAHKLVQEKLGVEPQAAPPRPHT